MSGLGPSPNTPWSVSFAVLTGQGVPGDDAKRKVAGEACQSVRFWRRSYLIRAPAFSTAASN